MATGRASIGAEPEVGVRVAQVLEHLESDDQIGTPRGREVRDVARLLQGRGSRLSCLDASGGIANAFHALH